MNAENDTKLGRLLVSQSGATLVKLFITLTLSLLCWGLAVILLVKFSQKNKSLAIALLFLGSFAVLAYLFEYLESIKCYERGIVIRKRTVLFNDIAAIEYLAIYKYTNGIYNGTVCHFEVIPKINNSVKIIISGSKRDDVRMQRIVQIILRSNPAIQRLKVRGL